MNSDKIYCASCNKDMTMQRDTYSISGKDVDFCSDACLKDYETGDQLSFFKEEDE